MALNVVTEFLQKTTVRVRAWIYDEDDALVDPTAVTIDIWNPSGTKLVDGVAMTKASTGIYDYYYDTTINSPTGNWRGIVWTTDTPAVSEGSFGFKVRA